MRWGLLSLALLAPWTGGCESYTERRSCPPGTVFAADGECVVPPPPDGGVSFETCAELCATVPGWTSAQLGCLETSLMMAGPLPAECGALETSAGCEACVAATGTDDGACALSRACL